MASNLTSQVRNIAEVATAMALGDLSRKITVHVQGEILELKNTRQSMVDQLTLSPRRSRAWHARLVPKVNWVARRSAGRGRYLEGPDGQRQFHGQ